MRIYAAARVRVAEQYVCHCRCEYDSAQGRQQ